MAIQPYKSKQAKMHKVRMFLKVSTLQIGAAQTASFGINTRRQASAAEMTYFGSNPAHARLSNWLNYKPALR